MAGMLAYSTTTYAKVAISLVIRSPRLSGIVGSNAHDAQGRRDARSHPNPRGGLVWQRACAHQRAGGRLNGGRTDFLNVPSHESFWLELGMSQAPAERGHRLKPGLGGPSAGRRPTATDRVPSTVP